MKKIICNELYKSQGLGNQLWNYAVTRIIAQKNGYDFSILKPERFKGKDFIDIDFGQKLTGGQTSPGGYIFRLPNGIENYYCEKRELYGQATTLSDMSQDISRTNPALLSLPANTKFDGNCQSTEYLNGYRKDILNWITVKKEYSAYQPEPDVCLIHLRLGDFRQHQAFLPIEYYKNAMDYIRSLKSDVFFQCVTDQKELAEEMLPGIKVVGSSLLNQKDEHRADHHHGGPIGIDFSLLMNAQYLIIPNSSFSWWAAYLNRVKKAVIAPKYWARFNIADGLWSPADIITEDFIYLDKEGKGFSPAQCQQEKTDFEKKHHHLFNTDNTLNKIQKPRSTIEAYFRFFIKKFPVLLKKLFKTKVAK